MRATTQPRRFFIMLKKVRLFTNGEEHDVPMLATGTTAIRYRAAFGHDLLQDIAAMDKGETLDYETIARLAYIMSAQAEGTDLKNATVDDYYAWLDKLDGDSILTASRDILGVYLSSRMTTAHPKNLTARQIER